MKLFKVRFNDILGNQEGENNANLSLFMTFSMRANG